jgi:hypothetical protein
MMKEVNVQLRIEHAQVAVGHQLVVRQHRAGSDLVQIAVVLKSVALLAHDKIVQFAKKVAQLMWTQLLVEILLWKRFAQIFQQKNLSLQLV